MRMKINPQVNINVKGLRCLWKLKLVSSKHCWEDEDDCGDDDTCCQIDCISAVEERRPNLLPKPSTYKRYIMMTCELFLKHCYSNKNNADTKS